VLKQTRIIALDPGGTTGWATAIIEDHTLETIECGQGVFTALGLWTMFIAYAPHYIVCETFRYRTQSRAGLDLSSMKWIGICELYTEQSGDACLLKMQEPSEGKGFWHNGKLKDAGLYVPGKPHSMDGLRHLLYFLTFKAGSQMWQRSSEYPFLNQYVQQQ